MTKTAFVELLSSAQLLVDAAERCAKVATLWPMLTRTVSVSTPPCCKPTWAQMERATKEIADLRALTVRYKSQIRTH